MLFCDRDCFRQTIQNALMDAGSSQARSVAQLVEAASVVAESTQLSRILTHSVIVRLELDLLLRIVFL